MTLNALEIERGGRAPTGAGADDLIRMGATFGFACFILYAGRRHYLNVAAAALGFRRHDETRGYSVWAARGLLLSGVLSLWVLQVWAGLHWIFSATMIGGIPCTVLVIARVNAEGGVFFFLPGRADKTRPAQAGVHRRRTRSRHGLRLLRLRLPRWPLHPVLMVALSSWAVNVVAPSILLGWFFVPV